MHYVVFDLEWNMANPWEKIDPQLKEKMPYEIIEIGAVKLDENGKDLGSFNVRIKPTLYKNLNRHVGKVTQMTQLSLQTGYPFKQAIAGFRAFCGEDYCLCSWSDSDSEPLKRNLAFHGFPEELGVRVVNVQSAFTQLIEPGEGQRNVEYALDLLKLSKKDAFHRALSDARYTAQVLAKLMEMAREDGETDFFRRYSYNPDLQLKAQIFLPATQDFAEAERLMQGEALFCPHCRAELLTLEPWHLQGKLWKAQRNCPEHGEVMARCRMRKGREGKILANIHLQIVNS